jgi:hypothetical protein
LLSLSLVIGCDGDRPPKVVGPSEKFAGERASVRAGDVQLGFSMGTMRVDVKQHGFRISKRPVDAEQFSACVDAEACPAGGQACSPNLGKKGRAEDQPAWCVGKERAEAFCAWVGGKLPTLNEWLAAARGRDVRRYPWGDEQPTCSQSPFGVKRDADEAAEAVPCAQEVTFASYRLGKHAEGASPSGMEDVLLLPNELIAAEPSAVSPACQNSDCLVFGLMPGGIDGVREFSEPKLEDAAWDGAAPDGAYGFRCVWEAGQ